MERGEVDEVLFAHNTSSMAFRLAVQEVDGLREAILVYPPFFNGKLTLGALPTLGHADQRHRIIKPNNM